MGAIHEVEAFDESFIIGMAAPARRLRRRASSCARTAIGCAVLSCMTALPVAAQQVSIEKDGWKANINGLVSVWSGSENYAGVPGRPHEVSSRVRTGFNPSKLEVTAMAPQYNGLNVSAYFQIATSINGSKTQRTGEQIEVRGADISVGSPYGTFSAGRMFNIYGSLPIVNDTGSMRGVGYLCTGPDGAGPNCGHIGTGYTWSDFSAGVRYASPRVNGLQIRLGAYEPIETAFGEPGGGAPFIGLTNGTFTNFTSIGTAIETRSPLLQGDISWASGPVQMGSGASGSALLWVGGLRQHVKDIANAAASDNTTNIKGFNAGGRLSTTVSTGVFGLTGNYEKSWGIAEGFMGFGAKCNATGCDAVKGDQWYLNGDFTFAGKTTVGASYGRGTEDANALVGNDDVKRRLTMVYIQHQLTPALNINLELQRFKRRTDGAGVAAAIFLPQERYTAGLVGLEFRF